MLLEEIKKIKSTPQRLREFGFVVGGALVVISGVFAWRHGAWNWPLAGLGAALAAIGVVLPQALVPLQKVWMALALTIGWVMSRVILTLLFFVIVTPLALVLRAQGKRFFERHADPRVASYWNLRTPESNAKQCEKQY